MNYKKLLPFHDDVKSYDSVWTVTFICDGVRK